MKKSVRLMGWFIFLSLIFAGGVVFAVGTSTVSKPETPGDKPTPGITPRPSGQCCIAGSYKGVHKDNPTPTKSCPKPETGDFFMEINQDKGCGSKIWGEVKDPKDGSTRKFEGTVTPGKDGCCNIQGVIMRRPGRDEETKFKGTLCKKGGKWAGKGAYTDRRDSIVCNGTWEMSQM